MRISSFQKRRVSTDDSNSVLSYNLDMSVSNSTGIAKFGVSGFIGESDTPSNSRALTFTLKSGRVFDPEDRCVHSYQKDTDINFKGTFLTTSYDYFINNDLICSKGSKVNFKIRDFFFDVHGLDIDLKDLELYTKKGSLTVSEDMTVDVYPANTKWNAMAAGPLEDETVTFTNAITFTSDDGYKASILSGNVGSPNIGTDVFEFDNSPSNIASLADVNGNSTKKDLKLKLKQDLAVGDYPLSLDLYTSFGKVSTVSIVRAQKGENPSGVQMEIEAWEEGDYLEGSVKQMMFLEATSQDLGVVEGGGQPIEVSGVFNLGYDASFVNEPETTDGLPYKVYLEHVDGDHAKQYSLITGVSLSGSGQGYLVDEKKIRFRTGEQGTYSNGIVGSAGISFGLSVNDEAVGLVSSSAAWSSKIVETHASSIRTNMYNVGESAGTDSASSLQGGVKGKFYKTTDGYLLLQRLSTPDIVTTFPDPDGDDVTYPTKVRASGVPVLYDYTKPASDWKLYIGPDLDNMTEQPTGKDDAVGLYHTTYTTAGSLPYMAVKAKNYVDEDDMVYDLVVSGADGFTESYRLTGAASFSGQIYPLKAFI